MALSRKSARCSCHRKVAHDLAEAAEDRRERRTQAVHGKVARKHAPSDAEEVDHRAHDVAVGRRGPRLTALAESRDLYVHVRTGREHRHRALPSCETLGAAIRRQPRVIEDDRSCPDSRSPAAPLPQDATTASADRSAARDAQGSKSLRATSRRWCRPAYRHSAWRWRVACDARCARMRTPPALRECAARRGRRATPARPSPLAGRARGAARRYSASHPRDRADPIPLRHRRTCRRSRGAHPRDSPAGDSGGRSRRSRRSETGCAACRSATGSNCVPDPRSAGARRPPRTQVSCPRTGCVTSLTDRSPTRFLVRWRRSARRLLSWAILAGLGRIPVGEYA